MAAADELNNILSALSRSAGRVAEGMNKLDAEVQVALRTGHTYREHAGDAAARAFAMKTKFASKTLDGFNAAIDQTIATLKGNKKLTDNQYREINNALKAQQVLLENNTSKLYKTWDDFNTKFPAALEQTLKDTFAQSSGSIAESIKKFNIAGANGAEAALGFEDFSNAMLETVNAIKSGNILKGGDTVSTELSDSLVKNIRKTSDAAFKDIFKELNKVNPVVANALEAVRKGATLTSDQAVEVTKALESGEMGLALSRLTHTFNISSNAADTAAKGLLGQLSDVNKHVKQSVTQQVNVLDGLLKEGDKLSNGEFSKGLEEAFTKGGKDKRLKTLFNKYLNNNLMTEAEKKKFSERMKAIEPELNDALVGIVETLHNANKNIAKDTQTFSNVMSEKLKAEYGQRVEMFRSMDGFRRGVNNIAADFTIFAASKALEKFKLGLEQTLRMNVVEAQTGMKATGPIDQISEFFKTGVNPEALQQERVARKDLIFGMSSDYDKIHKAMGESVDGVGTYTKSQGAYDSIVQKHLSQAVELTGRDREAALKLQGSWMEMSKLVGFRGADIDKSMDAMSKSFGKTTKVMRKTPTELAELDEALINSAETRDAFTDDQRQSAVELTNANMALTTRLFGSSKAAEAFEQATLKNQQISGKSSTELMERFRATLIASGGIFGQQMENRARQLKVDEKYIVKGADLTWYERQKKTTTEQQRIAAGTQERFATLAKDASVMAQKMAQAANQDQSVPGQIQNLIFQQTMEKEGMAGNVAELEKGPVNAQEALANGAENAKEANKRNEELTTEQEEQHKNFLTTINKWLGIADQFGKSGIVSGVAYGLLAAAGLSLSGSATALLAAATALGGGALGGAAAGAGGLLGSLKGAITGAATTARAAMVGAIPAITGALGTAGTTLAGALGTAGTTLAGAAASAGTALSGAAASAGTALSAGAAAAGPVLAAAGGVALAGAAGYAAGTAINEGITKASGGRPLGTMIYDWFHEEYDPNKNNPPPKNKPPTNVAMVQNQMPQPANSTPVEPPRIKPKDLGLEPLIDNAKNDPIIDNKKTVEELLEEIHVAISLLNKDTNGNLGKISKDMTDFIQESDMNTNLVQFPGRKTPQPSINPHA